MIAQNNRQHDDLLVLVGIAGISLIVGGIGIMNIIWYLQRENQGIA
jgi:ABC-type antimicrobial peptide transport system permease subunit